jgi:hypothetical protein
MSDRIPPLNHWRFRIRLGAWVLVTEGVESFPFSKVVIRSGNGRFMNDPSACAIKNHGPIPPGWYDLGAPVDHPHTFGHYGLPMLPWPGNEMYERSGFFFHGASTTHPDDSSDGCPFTPPGELWVREHVHNSGINVVEVVAD